MALRGLGRRRRARRRDVELMDEIEPVPISSGVMDRLKEMAQRCFAKDHPPLFFDETIGRWSCWCGAAVWPTGGSGSRIVVNPDD